MDRRSPFDFACVIAKEVIDTTDRTRTKVQHVHGGCLYMRLEAAARNEGRWKEGQAFSKSVACKDMYGSSSLK